MKDLESFIIKIVKKTDIKSLEKLVIDSKEASCLRLLCDFYAKHPTEAKYVLKSPILFNKFFFCRDYGLGGISSCFENLSLKNLKAIEKLVTEVTPTMRYYIECSDNVYKSEEVINTLHKTISTKKTNQIITAFRGDRHLGILSQIPLSPVLTKRIKFLNKLWRLFIQKAEVPVYETNIFSGVRKDINLYKYINDKEILTLADAMEMCRFLDKGTIKKILTELNGVKIQDTRFKSFTLSPSFPERWFKKTSYGHNQAKMIQKTKIQSGTEAVYIDDMLYPNGQFEIIVNNNPKQVTFSNAKFDKKKNIFYIDSELSQL